MKLDRLLQELAVALSRFEKSSAFPAHWEAPLTLEGISLCALCDFPDGAALGRAGRGSRSDAEVPDQTGWIATVSEPPIASVVFASPHASEVDREAERSLASLLCREIFPGPDPSDHTVSPLQSFDGNPVAALLTTHAPPDSLILSLLVGLGPTSASIFILCDGKRRRDLELVG
ncbi:MAG: hypothetical protein HKP27_11330 [Myxococcales bacterium]|nr:hypothetical protein [Myxococcales bacterium]